MRKYVTRLKMPMSLAMLLIAVAGFGLTGCDDRSAEHGAEADPEAPAAAVPTAMPGVTSDVPPEVGAGDDEVSNSPAAAEEAAEVASLPVLDLAGMQELVKQAAADEQILVVDFWATWCVPCVAMFGPLHDAMAEHDSRVRMVSVTLDVPGDTEQKAIAFLKEHHAIEDGYMMVVDTDARFAMVDGLGQTWYDLAVPAVLVFKDGQLVGEFLGSDAQVDAITRKVTSLMQ